MLRRIVLALLIAAVPSLGLAQSRGASSFNALTVTGAVSAGSVVTSSLALGGFTLTGVGTTAGTFAAGNDARIVGAAQKSANLSDLASLSVARTNLGAAASGANTDITGLGGLTVPLSAAQGGTGYGGISAALDGLFSSTQGAILYRGSAGWTALAPNTAGYVLSTNGTGANPAWIAAGGTTAILYTSQSLTLPQQLQARQNIGSRGAGITAKSAAYTVATTDAGKLIAASGTWSLTLPSAATAGNGFQIEVSNTGTGKITITPNGSDTISGATSLVANMRESGVLVSDGATWQAVGFAPVVVAFSYGASSSYVRWSNGYTVQWGDVAAAASDTTVTFPLAFSATPVIVATITNAGASANELDAVSIGSKSASNFVGRPRYAITNNGTGIANATWNWRAEGYI